MPVLPRISRRFRPPPPPPQKEALPWYYRTGNIVITFFFLGPLAFLALPLIWWHPKLARGWKIGLTIAIAVLSWFLIKVTVAEIQQISVFYKQLGAF